MSIRKNSLTKILSFFLATILIVGSLVLLYPTSNVAEAIDIRPSATNSAKIPEIIVDEDAKTDPAGPYRVLDGEEEIIKKFTTVNLYSYFDTTKNDFANQDVKEQMAESWTSIQNKNVSSLNAGLTDELAKEIGGKNYYTKDNFEITYFFDLTIDDASLDKLNAAPENHIDIVFKLLEVAPTDDPPVVLYRCEGTSEWKMIPLTNVKNNGDYTITVRFYELCSVLFVDTKDSAEPNPDTDVTPDSGSSFPWWIIAIIAGVVLLSIFFIIFFIKRRKDDDEEEEEEEGINAPSSENAEATQENNDESTK